MAIKNIVSAKVQSNVVIKNIMINDSECCQNSCLDACTCTGNCE